MTPWGVLKYWGVCKCGKWGEAPKEFDERIHFLKCGSCGSAMYLDPHDPKLIAYRDEDKVTVGVMKQRS